MAEEDGEVMLAGELQLFAGGGCACPKAAGVGAVSLAQPYPEDAPPAPISQLLLCRPTFLARLSLFVLCW